MSGGRASGGHGKAGVRAMTDPNGAPNPSETFDGLEIGGTVERLDITRAWLVDPENRREGPGEVVVRNGILESATWLYGHDADAIDDAGIVVMPGLVDLHAHFREPGFEDAETVATGSAAAAHGGFTTVALMPNTSPAIDEASVLQRVRGAAAASGSPIEVLVYGAVTTGRKGETLAAMGELADGGAIGFSDDGVPVKTATILRNALMYAGMLGLPIVDHPEESAVTEGAEANEGLVAAVLGLKGWPASAEASCVARDIAVLADVLKDEPKARLHLTHLSTVGSIDLVRRAKAIGLPVTCDVTPHHLAFSDEWIAGSRRWAWQAVDRDGKSRDPWADQALSAPPYSTSLRVNPPLRTPEDAAACLAGLVDRTVDMIATDHAPHTIVDKEVEFGYASNGISGIETALGTILALVSTGRLPLRRAVEALTSGPAHVLGSWPGLAGSAVARPRGLFDGRPADLVVIDQDASWTVTPQSLLSKGKNTPLIGQELRGRTALTIARGRLAYVDPTPADVGEE